MVKNEEKLSLANTSAGRQIYNVQSKTKTTSQEREQKKVVISLRIPTAIALGIGSVLLLGWVFFLGVILGRGDMPEENIPQLESVLPKPTPLEPARVVEGKPQDSLETLVQGLEQGGNASANNTAGSTQTSAANSAVKPTAPSTKPATPATKPATPATKPVTSATKPVAPTVAPKTTDAKPAATATKPAVATAVASDKKTDVKAEDKEIFDYKFQVSAYRDKPSADALATKLSKDGVNAVVVQSADAAGVNWNRVVVSMRGSADDVASLQSKLKKYGINKIVRQSKKPVS